VLGALIIDIHGALIIDIHIAEADAPSPYWGRKGT